MLLNHFILSYLTAYSRACLEFFKHALNLNF